MFITIYQINLSRDKNGVAFEPYEWVCRQLGAPDASLYDPVFSGEVDCKDLEDVYRKFYFERPEGYKGRSLTVSDIVEVIDENGGSTFHFCDSVGFKQIEFGPGIIAQEDIDAVLIRGSVTEKSKRRIYEQFLKRESRKENIAFLKKEYGIGSLWPAVVDRNLYEEYDGKGLVIFKGNGVRFPKTKISLSWSRVEKRIGELISARLYL